MGARLVLQPYVVRMVVTALAVASLHSKKTDKNRYYDILRSPQRATLPDACQRHPSTTTLHAPPPIGHAGPTTGRGGRDKCGCDTSLSGKLDRTARPTEPSGYIKCRPLRGLCLAPQGLGSLVAGECVGYNGHPPASSISMFSKHAPGRITRRVGSAPFAHDAGLARRPTPWQRAGCHAARSQALLRYVSRISSTSSRTLITAGPSS